MMRMQYACDVFSNMNDLKKYKLQMTALFVYLFLITSSLSIQTLEEQDWGFLTEDHL